MKKTIAGLLLAMLALAVMHNNQPFIGLPMFIIGIVLMMYKKKK
ncbi:MAG: hypothetical protein V2I36_13355 [Desulfopila sp.]|jgi:hypothetical protein|nr:hypothetical protein [Desulfopila sp.]